MDLLVGILLIIIWMYLLWVFERGKLEFFKFIVGSVGLFFILLAATPYFKEPIINFFTKALGFVGTKTNLFEGYSKYGMFFINHNNTVMSLYVDLECSGLIEMMVYVSLIMFYPVYKGFWKLWVIFVGMLSIFIFNMVRVLVIIGLIYKFGSPIYSIAHSIIGRLVFYAFIIILYYNVFTKKQLKKQKVGSFGYGLKEEKEKKNEGVK